MIWLDDDSLQKYCLKLEYFLKYNVYYNIDGLDLFSELNVLKEILQIKYYTPIDILNYIKRLDSFLWGPIICDPGPFLHWGLRPEPRKVIAEDR